MPGGADRPTYHDADLRGADFRGADLADADFTGAKLANAQFAGADLMHADFTGATGLVGSQFARADLTGATMPQVTFTGFATANEIAEATSKLFLTVLLVCAYSWLTINSTLDSKLITDTAVSKLPILNAEIPIVNFYALVPLALLAMSIVAMLQAQRLWSAVAAAPAVLPDGEAMTDRASTWLVGGWAAERLGRDDRSRGALGRWQSRVTVFIGWWLVPITIGWFWARYLHRHDWPVTLLQLVALTASCAAAAAFLALANRTLPRAASLRAAPPSRARGWARPYVPAAIVAGAVLLVFGTASYGAITGVYRGVVPSATGKGGLADQNAESRPALVLEQIVPGVQAHVPQWLARMGISPGAQLSESEVSTRLTTTTAADTSSPEAKAAGARLIGADLRYALGERAFLAQSDLRRADLLGANLWSADLRGANLGGASLVGALLYKADLRQVRGAATALAERSDTLAGVAYFDTLFCGRVHFSAANLRYARFGEADVRGASFDHAMLQGANFAKARIQHATFVGADLDGADFRATKNLTVAQVLQARHIDALFAPDLLDALRARSPERFVGYDSAAVRSAADAQRESGEEEPDTASAQDRAARNALMQRAFKRGAPGTPTDGELGDWRARGRAAPVSADAVPSGCVMARSTVELRKSAG